MLFFLVYFALDVAYFILEKDPWYLLAMVVPTLYFYLSVYHNPAWSQSKAVWFVLKYGSVDKARIEYVKHKFGFDICFLKDTEGTNALERILTYYGTYSSHDMDYSAMVKITLLSPYMEATYYVAGRMFKTEKLSIDADLFF